MADLMPMLRGPFDRLRDELEGAFERFLPQRQGNGGTLPDIWSGTFFAPNRPLLEMDEDENEIRVTVELPGLKKEDFKVELADNRLTIRGEKKTSREEKKKDYYYSERSYGSFSRSLTLPSEVTADKVASSFKDGVLDIHLPKTEKAKAKKVEVKVS